jgi:hypothetical protein
MGFSAKKDRAAEAALVWSLPVTRSSVYFARVPSKVRVATESALFTS